MAGLYSNCTRVEYCVVTCVCLHCVKECALMSCFHNNNSERKFSDNAREIKHSQCYSYKSAKSSLSLSLSHTISCVIRRDHKERWVCVCMCVEGGEFIWVWLRGTHRCNRTDSTSFLGRGNWNKGSLCGFSLLRGASWCCGSAEGVSFYLTDCSHDDV